MAEENRVHGNDERGSVEDVTRGVRLTSETEAARAGASAQKSKLRAKLSR